MHEVGHVFVSMDTTRQFLVDFCGLDLLAFFCDKKIRNADLYIDIFKKPLLLVGVIEILEKFWSNSQRIWSYYLEKSQISIPRPLQ